MPTTRVVLAFLEWFPAGSKAYLVFSVLPQMVAYVGCVWLELDIVVTAAMPYDESTSHIRDSGCCRRVSPDIPLP